MTIYTFFHNLRTKSNKEIHNIAIKLCSFSRFFNRYYHFESFIWGCLECRNRSYRNLKLTWQFSRDMNARGSTKSTEKRKYRHCFPYTNSRIPTKTTKMLSWNVTLGRWQHSPQLITVFRRYFKVLDACEVCALKRSLGKTWKITIIEM